MSDSEENSAPQATEDKVEKMEEDNIDEKGDHKEEASKSTSEEETPKTPVKKAAKSGDKEKKVDNKGDKKDDEEDESGSEEESPKLGLLERPVVIESGKRERKKVERLSTADSTPKEVKKLEIGDGSGDKLGDCPRIEFHLSKTKGDDLKNLHRFLFNRAGKATEVKKHIRLFNGFSFKTSDPEYSKKLANLKKSTIPMLKAMCDVLDLEKKGTRDVIAERIMDFCMKPKDSGKKLPASKRKRSSTSKGSKGAKKEKKKKATKEKKSKAKAEDSGDEEEEEEEEESEEEEEEEEEEEAPKKKKQRTESPKKTKPEPKESKKKEKEKGKELSSPEISDSDSDEDEPLVKKKEKEPPTNDELKSVVKKILDKANLEEVTMKTVVKQVYAKYPEFDLTERKDFIKNTVKQMIS